MTPTLEKLLSRVPEKHRAAMEKAIRENRAQGYAEGRLKACQEMRAYLDRQARPSS